MTDYAHWLLNQLLDRYERSAHCHSPGHSRRAVALRFDRAGFPDYWDDSTADTRHLIHRAVDHLAAAGVVTVHGDRRAPGHQVARVDLALDRLAAAYQLAGRISRRQQAADLAAVAARWQGRLPAWAGPFLQDLMGALASHAPLPAGLAPGDAERLDTVCTALAAAPGPEAPLPRRVFSVRVFGDSKRFERAVAPTLIRIARAYIPGAPDDRRELLAELGIVDNPDFLFLWGPVQLDLPSGGRVDLGASGTELGIPARAVAAARIAGLAATRVITIENLTPFHQLVQAAPPATLALYLGGYHNRLRHQFLRRLYEYQPSLEFRHWGDIDLGGFRIFSQLRDGSGVPLRPWRMDAETLRQHLHLAAPFGAAYGRLLASLLADGGYQEFHDVIRLMMATERRLEQESVGE